MNKHEPATAPTPPTVWYFKYITINWFEENHDSGYRYLRVVGHTDTGNAALTIGSRFDNVDIQTRVGVDVTRRGVQRIFGKNVPLHVTAVALAHLAEAPDLTIWEDGSIS